MGKVMILGDMTREQIREIASSSTVLFPIGSIEQHGPHLPVSTDTAICEAVCQRAGAIASADIIVVITPTLCFGSSHHHFPYPALSLTSRAFHKVLCEILESLAISGFERVFIVNGHGGNEGAIRMAATDIPVRFNMRIASASYWTIARQALAEELGFRDVGHAGGFETSLMMSIRPDLVSPDTKPPRREGPPVSYSSRLDILEVWRHNQVEQMDGYSDDARDASKEFGDRSLAIIVREVAEAIMRFGRS